MKHPGNLIKEEYDTLSISNNVMALSSAEGAKRDRDGSMDGEIDV